MKYDFSTYILNKLNEAEKPSYNSVKDIEDKLSKWEIKDGELCNSEGDEVSEDVLYQIKKSKGWNEYKTKYKDDKKYANFIKIIDKANNIDKDSGVVKSYSTDTFDKLGRTVAYRSTVCFIKMNESDFKEITNDVFENDPDNVLLQIKDLPSYLDFAAACTTVNHKMNKEEKDSESHNIASSAKELLSKPDTRFAGIDKIKKEISKDFTKYRDQFENAFNEGMKAQQTEMTKPDFKWVDPATGLPPKGFGQNAKKILGKGIQQITALGNKFADKVKNSPHNLENDMARAAIIGVKLIALGVHGLGKLLPAIFGAGKSIYNTLTQSKIKAEMDKFEKKLEEAKKGNYLPSLVKDDADEETKNKCKKIERDFQDLMYSYLIPYYYKQTLVFIECYQNTNDKFILKQGEEGWFTDQTENGKFTELWNAVLLLKEFINNTQKYMEKHNLYTEFKDTKMDLLLGNVEKNTPNVHQQDLLNWFDKVDTEKTDTEKLDALKHIVNIYTKNIMMPSLEISNLNFAQFKDKLDKSLQDLNVVKEIPITKEFKIQFKTDDITSNVKGIIPLKEEKKEEQPEELPKEIEQKEEQQYSKIMDELSTLSKVNDTENLVQNFDKTNNDINKAYELMKNNISKLDNEGAKKLLGNLEMDNADMLKKLMYLNTAKSSGVFKESTVLGEALLLLEGANADELFSKVYSFLKKDNLTEDDVRKFNHYYTQFVQKLSNILKSGNIKDNELKELLTQHKDPLERYYILKIWQKEKENKPEEEKKEEGEQTKKPDQENGENNQETQSS